MTPSVSAFESIVAAGTPFTRAQAETLLADPDLVSVGMLGEQARVATTGDRVAYGRVLCWSATSHQATAPITRAKSDWSEHLRR